MNAVVQKSIDTIQNGLTEYGEELKEQFDTANWNKPTETPKPNVSMEETNEMKYTN